MKLSSLILSILFFALWIGKVPLAEESSDRASSGQILSGSGQLLAFVPTAAVPQMRYEEAFESVAMQGTLRPRGHRATDPESQPLLGHQRAARVTIFGPDDAALSSAVGETVTSLPHGAIRRLSAELSPRANWGPTGGRDPTLYLYPAPVATPIVRPVLADNAAQHGDADSTPPSQKPEAHLSIRPLEAKAGDDLTLLVRVTNGGRAPLYGLQGKTKSPDPALDGHLFDLGKIEAGRHAEYSVVVRIPIDQGDADVPVRIEFEERNGRVPDPLQALVTVKGLPRPRFTYTYRILDDGSGTSSGNGDGRIQPGEVVDLLLTVKNVGTVAARDTHVEIKSATNPDLSIREENLNLGSLKPEETKAARMSLSVHPDSALAEIPLHVLVRESGFNAALSETLKLPVDRHPPTQVVATNKRVVVRGAAATLHSGAGSETSVIGSAEQGRSLPVTGELDEWYRVHLSDTETAWVAKREVGETPLVAGGTPSVATDEAPAPTGRGSPMVAPHRNGPPVIALASPVEGQVISAADIQLLGAAASEKGIARVEVRNNGQLLAQRESRGIIVKGVGVQGTANVQFSERVPLQEGRNEISVTAFDQDNRAATRTVIVTRLADRGKIWAVLIGISRYKTVRSLHFADRDAQGVYEYLLKQVGVPKEQMTLLTNEQATLFNLKRSLGTDLRRSAGPEDTVIIYFAGHGAPETDATSPDGDGLEKYLVPYDADPNDLYATALPMREVETILQRLASDRVVFITDSCFSGATAGRTFMTAARRAVPSDSFLSRLVSAKGRVVLTASRASEISEESNRLGHGVFTYYLLQGLEGKADLDGDGLITVDEVYSYVSKKVPEATGQNQHPLKKGEVEGQLVLGRVRR